MFSTLAIASTLAVQDIPGSDAGAKGLVVGVVVLTVIAGLLAAVQRLRRSEAWPVPLIIYCTLLPITLFVLVTAELLDEGLGYGYVAAVAAPLPLIFFLKRTKSA